MNVDRMKHQLDRTGEAAEHETRKRWLASLTPAYRARHERPMRIGDSFCSECHQVSIASAMEKIREGFGWTVAGRRMPPSVLIVGGPS